MKKILVMLICFAFIATVGITVSAQSDTIRDPTGDVMQYRWQDGRYGWSMNVGNKPNIDITEVKYSVSDNKVTLSLTVDGMISYSEEVGYNAYLVTEDSNYYFMWLDGEGIGMATSTGDGTSNMDMNPEIVATGDTITATYEIIGTFSTVEEFYGTTTEYTVIGDTSSEWWTDWAPNEQSPYQAADQTGHSDPTNPTGGTPGFELFALIAAFAAVVFIIKKRN
jgi:hypothetical protein